MLSYYGVDIAEKKKTILKNNQLTGRIKSIISGADKAATEDSPAFKMSEYMLYFQTGDRTKFEAPYFKRRENCYNLMVAYWLTEDEKYLTALIDYISYICDEFTWCVPAHNRAAEVTSYDAVEQIDLFQAETARLFSEIIMCVGEKLPSFITVRMNDEIKKRIIAPFEKGAEFWWQTSHLNWATVCAAGCAIALLTFGTEGEINRLMPGFINCMDAYLEGIFDDGCCREGSKYWTYGFWNYLKLATAIKLYTKGEIDYFNHPKAKKEALFLQKVRLSDSLVVCFADDIETFTFSPSMLSFMKSVYDDVALPDLKFADWTVNTPSVVELLWFADDYKSEKLSLGTHFFEDSGWYIKRSENYSFAAKGGYNMEPHNHNDAGSFMITVGDNVFMSDLGSAEYTREYFDSKTRYTIVTNSSRGHSVPVINGEYQQFGAEFCAENVKGDDNSFELDIESAYKSGIVNRINRRFDFNTFSIKLTDTFEPSVNTKTITERFITKIPPVINAGYVDMGVGKIKYDVNRYKPQISSEQYNGHRGLKVITAYIIDFVPVNSCETVFEFEFVPGVI